MSPSQIRDELRIFAPCGQLGQGWNDEVFWQTLRTGNIDAIILDSGSTDSGPGRLAQGKPNVPVARLEKDIHTLVKACHIYRVPVLVGSSGGDGENAMVDMCIKIITDTVKKFGFRPMKVLSIYSEIPKEHVYKKMDKGEISPCGEGVPELTKEDVAASTRIVAQMGLEPYLKAMQENPGFDIIMGGRAYDPAPFAAFCLYKGFNNMGVNYAMGKVLECGGLCCKPKSRSAMAIVRQHNFDVVALDPGSKATPISVAAHFLYEHTRPDVLLGPGGATLLDETQYEQIDERTVRVSGARFAPEPEGEYTVKLEGARNRGFHTIFIGALRDPILISQLDPWIGWIKDAAREKFPDFPWDLKIHTYGVNGVMGHLEPDDRLPKEVGIAGQVRAETQDQANQVASMVKFYFTHAAYPGQVATAGNFAWPFTPSEVPMGPSSEFCVYHIMHKTDPLELFPIRVHRVEGDNSFVSKEVSGSAAIPFKSLPSRGTTAGASKLKPLVGDPAKRYYLTPEPAPGTCYLGDVATVVRSKNAGPYQLTFDVMFPNQEVCEKVKSAGLLSAETMARLYGIPLERVVTSMYFDQAMAYKATITRAAASGGFGETDTHASQQHVPLLYLNLPWARQGETR
ncbi:hypothetical protein CLAIMM_15120 [Cladophialophora immunda]|nr:hypothetical protein CLAIMM_15120 [Cladophialophora immunda]